MNSTVRTEHDTEAIVRQAICKMLALKLRAGASTEQLRELVSVCVVDTVRDFRLKGKILDLDIHVLGGVLRSWYTETRFLTLEGTPKALRLAGRLSLKGLIKHHYPKGNAQEVVSALRKSGLIRARKDGCWLPTDRHARVPQPTAELLAHFAEGILRFAETVTSNTSSRDKNDLLFERACKVRRLPVSEAKSFRAYVRTQGIAFITAIDDWLESRTLNEETKNRPTCAAGVYTFAFVGASTRKDKGKISRRKGGK